MGDIIIRPVKPEDYKGIYELNVDLGYPYEASRVKQRIVYVLHNTSDIVLAAELDGEIAGYIHGSPYEVLYNDSLINVLGLVVKEKARRLGIGKRLMEEMESYAKVNGFSGIRLSSGESRADAHRFYESIGYVNRKNHKNFVKIFT